MKKSKDDNHVSVWSGGTGGTEQSARRAVGESAAVSSVPPDWNRVAVAMQHHQNAAIPFPRERNEIHEIGPSGAVRGTPA